MHRDGLRRIRVSSIHADRSGSARGFDDRGRLRLGLHVADERVDLRLENTGGDTIAIASNDASITISATPDDEIPHRVARPISIASLTWNSTNQRAAPARADNPSEQADIRTVEGAELLAAGKMIEARTVLTSALKDGDVVTEMLLARALSATGDDAGALKHWDVITTRFGYGLEGQFDVQMAQVERAKVLERLGRTSEAIEALRALVSKYPVRGAEPDPTALADARLRLRRQEQGGR